jgi:hypothetical protein
LLGELRHLMRQRNPSKDEKAATRRPRLKL